MNRKPKKIFRISFTATYRTESGWSEYQGAIYHPRTLTARGLKENLNIRFKHQGKLIRIESIDRMETIEGTI